MFLLHILLQIVPVQTEVHTFSTSFRQGVIEDPLDDLAAAPISSTNAAAIFPNIRAQDPVTAHMLQIHTHIQRGQRSRQRPQYLLAKRNVKFADITLDTYIDLLHCLCKNVNYNLYNNYNNLYVLLHAVLFHLYYGSHIKQFSLLIFSPNMYTVIVQFYRSFYSTFLFI